MLEALDRFVGTGRSLAAIEIAPQRFDEYVVYERTFSGAGNTGDADEYAQGNLDGDVLQIVVRRPADAELVFADHSPLLWHFDLGGTAEILPGQAARLFHQHGRRSLDNYFAPANSGSRPEVDDVIGGTHGVFVMLDHDHGVSHVTETTERVD